MNFYEYVDERFREVVADAGDDGIKRDDAIGRLLPEVERALALRDISLPVDPESLIRAHLEREDKGRRGRQARDIEHLRAIAGDETILGIDDPWLNTVCVVGDGLRKAWRHVSGDDLLAIAQIKVDKAAEAATAAQRCLNDAMAVRKVLAQYGADATVGVLAS